MQNNPTTDDHLHSPQVCVQIDRGGIGRPCTEYPKLEVAKAGAKLSKSFELQILTGFLFEHGYEAKITMLLLIELEFRNPVDAEHGLHRPLAYRDHGTATDLELL
jgi:hypothetical protein